MTTEAALHIAQGNTVTTNPTIFARAITGSDAYSEQIRDLWTRGTCVHEALRALTTHDVRAACDVLRPG